jgi:hypothetical protein
VGHIDIHNHDIRLELPNLVDGLTTIGCLTDDTQVLLLLNQHAQTFAQHGMIINEQDGCLLAHGNLPVNSL